MSRRCEYLPGGVLVCLTLPLTLVGPTRPVVGCDFNSDGTPTWQWVPPRVIWKTTSGAALAAGGVAALDPLLVDKTLNLEQ